MIRFGLGCDVGPRKGGVLFDGAKYIQREPQELIDHLADLSPEVLVAWDSPLTGPADPDGQLAKGGQDLTHRPIDAFFRTSKFKTPKGISVQPYSGCSHWTISMRVLGLPRIGRYSLASADLPLRLVFNQRDLLSDDPRPAVTEVHPAVAMWLWCRHDVVNAATWLYKRNPARVAELWPMIAQKLGVGDLPAPKNDDHLDALVAWVLADRWIRGEGVVCLGTHRTGSYLVPDVDGISGNFASFIDSL